MDYSHEQIEFVAFCVDKIECSIKECPSADSCPEENQTCSAIPTKMKKGLELVETEKSIIDYFLNSELWKRNACVPKQRTEECPNARLCEAREEKSEDSFCRELLLRLGIFTQEQYAILESEIEKIIVNNSGAIAWGVGESLLYRERQRRIPVGTIDILMQGKVTKMLYVVELKPELATREHVGQLQSYVQWYKENTPSQFKGVKGILLAKRLDIGAKYAIKANPDLMARCFELLVSVREEQQA